VNRVVLITGAARGIGAATARELARRGATVALTGIEPERLRVLAEELGARHAWFEADVTDQHSIDSASRRVADRFGRIDAVIANAGVVNHGTVRTADPDAFARTVDVNLTGVYRTIAAALPHLIASHGYALVMGSVASLVPLPGANAYAASKAGLDQLVRGLRVELAHTGVTVGIAYPSWVDTEMVRDSERALPSFARMRRELPWPVRSTHTPEECARVLAAAVESRSKRVFFPRWIGLVNAIKPIINSPIGEILMTRRTADVMPAIDADVHAKHATDAIEQGT
jgi:NAD(P)-dependent dehydrogenase (short-subunit alcohol dehydrogenase family)